jgi:mevalonate kinase
MERGNQTYYGHGKLLLSGEYLVLYGAKALAVPTRLGQKMKISWEASDEPVLKWRAQDHEGRPWLESSFERWNFDLLSETGPESIRLRDILRQARKLNPHFFRENANAIVETKVEFPLDWGLGSSSTLIYNLAQWAFVSPFELLFKTSPGSGYDVACADSEGPILFERDSDHVSWEPVAFDPPFKDHLFFVHLGNKVDSNASVREFMKKDRDNVRLVKEASILTDKFLAAVTLEEFASAMRDHEEILTEVLGIPTVKNSRFQDFSGEVKSLGAWGGDFVLAASADGLEQVREYFNNKGCSVVIPYNEMVLDTRRGKE